MDKYAYGIWFAVAVNVAIFIFFTLSFLKPKKYREWRSMGVFGAFIVALFTEMYGFPLSIYLLTGVLGSRYPVSNPFTHENGNLLGVFLGGSAILENLFMFIGGILMVAGLFIMGKAFGQIHRANGNLVTDGLYQQVRHPQYSALFLVMIGMLVQWPTVVTLLMFPILVLMYYRLARREEKEMLSLFGSVYQAYMRKLPMFIPNFGSRTAIPTGTTLSSKDKPI